MRLSVVAADPNLNARLRDALNDNGGPVGSTLYAVVDADESVDVGRRLHRLYAYDGDVKHRSSEPRRTIQALASHLGHYELTDDASLGFFAALALVRDDQATVVPIDFWRQLPRLAKAAERAGCVLADAPGVAVDSHTGELVVPEPLFDAAAVVPGDPAPDRRPMASPAVAPGRYRISTWVANPEPTQPSDELVLWDTWRVLKRAQLFGPDRDATMAAARQATRSANVISLDDMTVPALLGRLADVA